MTLWSLRGLVKALDGYLEVPEVSAPATPGTAKVRIYAKSDGHVYIKDDAGTETDLTGGGDVSAAAALTDNAIVRGDGGAKGVQTSAPTIADDGSVDNVTDLDIGVAVGSGEDGAITVAGASFTSPMMIHDLGTGWNAGVNIHKHSTTAAPTLLFSRANTDNTTHAVVTSGQQLGLLAFVGHDGTDYATAGYIYMTVGGTPGSNDMPGKIHLATSPDSSQTPADQLTIAQDGLVNVVTKLQTPTIELGHASDTTLARSGVGDITIEGNAVYRAGGTDVPVNDGGTGGSTADAATLNLGDGTSRTPTSTSDRVLARTNGGAGGYYTLQNLLNVIQYLAQATSVTDGFKFLVADESNVAKYANFEDLDPTGALLISRTIEYTGSGSSGKTVTLTGINRAHHIMFFRNDTTSNGPDGGVPMGGTGNFNRRSYPAATAAADCSLDAPAAGVAQVLTINNTLAGMNTAATTYRLVVIGTPT